VDLVARRWGFRVSIQGLDGVGRIDGGEFGASLVWGETAKVDEVNAKGGFQLNTRCRFLSSVA
jgi:hypothetical protein